VGLLRQSLITFLARMTITLVNIPISMIIARTLGVEGQGIYSAAIALPNLWAGFGLLGLDAAHLYFLARDRGRWGPLVINSLVILLVLSAVLLPAYLLLISPLMGERGEALGPYLLLSSVIVPLILARLLCLSLFLGVGQIDRYNGLAVLAQIALLGMVVLGLLVAGAGSPAERGTRFVILAYQLSLLVFLVPAVLWARRQTTAADRGALRFSRPLLSASVAYGLKGHLGVVFTQFSYRFDTVLILRWLGTAAQGYYSIAVLLAEKLTHITASVQFALFPRISASPTEDANRLTPLVCRTAFMWMAAAGGAMFLLGEFLIRIFYTAAYLPALGALRALLPGIVALTFSHVLSSDLSGRNQRTRTTIAMGVGFAINLLLNFLWIPRWGIEGAAWASTVSYTVQGALMAVFFCRLTGIPPGHLVVPRREDLAAYRAAISRLRANLKRKG